MLPFTKVSSACGRIPVLCYHLIEAMCAMVREGKGGGGSESEPERRRRQITEMTHINISQACIISILVSSPYILYTRKTNDVLYMYSAYSCVGGVERVLGKVGLPYYTPVDTYPQHYLLY